METFKKWANSPFGIGTAIVISGIAAFIFIGLWFNLNKSEWAYWVQALGSIGAIVGTWYATKTQLEHAAAGRAADLRLNDAANAQTAYNLAFETSRALNHIYNQFHAKYEQNQGLKTGTERLEALRRSLQDFASRPISPQLYAEMLCLQREISFTITAVDQQSRKEVVAIERVNRAAARNKIVDASLQKIEILLKQALKLTGASEHVAPTANTAEAFDTEN